MKILLFTGNHPRHLYISNIINKTKHKCFSIIEKREEFIPKPNKNLNNFDKSLYELHFKERKKIEYLKFSNLKPETLFYEGNFFYVKPNGINSVLVNDFLKNNKFDICFVFGTTLIHNEILKLLPDYSFNFHLGLSPNFKGSATLFWPFYLLMPQYCGFTIHKMNNKPDAGDILHQNVPKLSKNDGIHNVAANTVLKLGDDLIKLLDKLENQKINFIKQSELGKTWMRKDFEPHHLRLIYNEFGNKIVDLYLDGKLGTNKPKIINILS